MSKVKVTTRISRDEAAIAQLADPRRKDVHWTRRETGRQMVGDILKRMENLIHSISKNAYVRFCHARDRAFDLEDMVATVKGELVLALYRYKIQGKYEPLNYLLGVVHVVLKNIHNHRNRHKRNPTRIILVKKKDPLTGQTPRDPKTGRWIIVEEKEYVGGIVSMHTPKLVQGPGRRYSSTLEEFLKENLSAGDALPSLINRMDVENLFRAVKGRLEVVTFRENGAKIRRRVSCGRMVEMLLDGESLVSVSRQLRIPKHVTKEIVQDRLLPALAA